MTDPAGGGERHGGGGPDPNALAREWEAATRGYGPVGGATAVEAPEPGTTTAQFETAATTAPFDAADAASHEPTPATNPEPEPIAVVEPVAEPEPQPQPAPEPVVEAVPEPAPQPSPEPEPFAEPAPAPEPVAEPEPQPTPEPQPAPAPEPAPIAEAEPAPEPAPAPGSDRRIAIVDVGDEPGSAELAPPAPAGHTRVATLGRKPLPADAPHTRMSELAARPSLTREELREVREYRQMYPDEHRERFGTFWRTPENKLRRLSVAKVAGGIAALGVVAGALWALDHFFNHAPVVLAHTPQGGDLSPAPSPSPSASHDTNGGVVDPGPTAGGNPPVGPTGPGPEAGPDLSQVLPVDHAATINPDNPMQVVWDTIDAHPDDYRMVFHNGYWQVANADGKILNAGEMGVFNSLMG